MMRHRLVRDIMVADPVTVTPATSLKDVAGILVRQRAGCVLVTKMDGSLAGVVTETGLLEKEELQHDPDGHHRTHMSYRARRAIATAETAGDLMTTHPATVRPEATVAEAARLMDKHQASSLPVTGENGQLLGVVGLRDLLRVFLRPDEEIRSEIISDVLVGYLATNPALVDVEVTDGVVTMTGELERKSLLPLALPAVRAVDGVIHVEGTFTYAIDDTSLPPGLGMADY